MLCKLCYQPLRPTEQRCRTMRAHRHCGFARRATLALTANSPEFHDGLRMQHVLVMVCACSAVAVGVSVAASLALACQWPRIVCHNASTGPNQSGIGPISAARRMPPGLAFGRLRWQLLCVAGMTGPCGHLQAGPGMVVQLPGRALGVFLGLFFGISD